MSQHSLLKLMVVRELLRGPISGYQLVKHIEQQTGWKPSFGSIYPLLEKMQQSKHVTVKTEGRSKIYSLTPTGKKFYNKQQEKQSEAYDNIIEQLRVLGSMGDEEALAAISMIENVKQGNVPFREIPESALAHKEMLRLLKEEKIKTNQKKLRQLFTRLHKELRKL